MFARLLLLSFLFVIVDCGALPAEKLPSFTSELIQHNEVDYEKLFLSNSNNNIRNSLNTLNGINSHFDNSQAILEKYKGIYSINVTIGTPAQHFRLVFGTIGSDIFVIDKDCKDELCDQTPSQDPHIKARYDYKKSSTAKLIDSHWETYFYNGKLISDKMTLNGISLNTQKFVSVDSKIFPVAFTKLDGEISFGKTANGTYDDNPLVDQLAKLFVKPEFTIALKKPTIIGETAPAGLVTFGGRDQKSCANSINYLPLGQKITHWEFNIDGYKIDKLIMRKQELVWPQYNTLFTITPSIAVLRVINNTKAEFNTTFNQYTVDCGKLDSFPAIEFTMGGEKYYMDGKDYVITARIRKTNEKICILGLYTFGRVVGYDWLFGDAFFRRYCVTFDAGRNKIGLSSNLLYNN